MTYVRVLPRDLFNEASLLKCHGKLWILLDNMNARHCSFPEDVPQFDIAMNEDDGSIFVANLPLTVRGVAYRLMRPLNSRRPWPLYAQRVDDDDADPVDVFNDDGELTVDMLTLIGARS